MGKGINFAATKGYIKESGMNASHDSVLEFQKSINQFAESVVITAKQLAMAEKRKTILPDHIVKASEAELGGSLPEETP